MPYIRVAAGGSFTCLIQMSPARVRPGGRPAYCLVLVGSPTRPSATRRPLPDVLAGLVAAATAPEPPSRQELAEWVRAGLGARRVFLADAAVADTTATPVFYGGAQIGLLRVEMGTAAATWASWRSRLRRIAPVLGPALRAVQLREELARQQRILDELADRLRASRVAAVSAQDEERRALERNLHDGAQHHLVALRVGIGLLEHELGSGQADAARERLASITQLLDMTERSLTTTAAGTLPGVLVRSGLVPAFADELRHKPQVHVRSDATVSGRRYPLQIEVNVYYACLEAVNNAAKHAPGAQVRVELQHSYRGLRFAVSDDGPGFDPATLSPGAGLVLLGDRIAAIGGSLTLRSAPGTGTLISGLIPI